MPLSQPYIALIGFPARDTKRFPDGTVQQAVGGVVFSALAMAALARSEDLRVVPIMHVGNDIADQVERLLAGAGCSLEAVHRRDSPTQHSTIRLTSANERWERVEGALPPLLPGEIAPWLTARSLAVNFITGVEMDLSTFRWLRQAYRGPIVADYHTLALATLPDGRREPRRRTNWAAWMQVPTVVQMNRAEAQALARRELRGLGDCALFARHLLSLGPQAVVVTLAELGAVGAERRTGQSGGSTYVMCCVPAEPPEHIVDTVGCGDVFLAALSVGWSRRGGLEPALRFAVRAAGCHCGYPGHEGIESLARIEPKQPAPCAMG